MATNGNDLVTAITDDELINGLGGDDTLESSFNRTVLIGGFGDDLLTTTAFSDQFLGSFTALATQSGDAGDDILTASATASGFGLDTVFATTDLSGGAGDDVIDAVATVIDAPDTGVTLNNILGGTGDDLITALADSAFQALDAQSRNVIDGGSGDDTIDATARGVANGADLTSNNISGGSGDDEITARTSSATNNSNPLQENILAGGTGDDILISIQESASFDSIPEIRANLNGGRGDDDLTATVLGRGEFGVTVGTILIGDRGADILIADVTTDLLGGAAVVENDLRGGVGSDELTATIVTESQEAIDALNLLNGGGEDDTLSGTVVGTGIGGATISVTNELIGGGGDDEINADARMAIGGGEATARNDINAGSGDDVVDAIARIDIGSFGPIGTAENVIQGGKGDDQITAFAETDGEFGTFVSRNIVNGGAGDDDIDVMARGEGPGDFVIENTVTGGGGADVVNAVADTPFNGSGLSVSNTISGNGGDDTLTALAVGDASGISLALNTINGDGGDDVIVATTTTNSNADAPTSRNELFGGSGDDDITSNQMADFQDAFPTVETDIKGGSGSDTLTANIDANGDFSPVADSLLDGGTGDDVLTSAVSATGGGGNTTATNTLLGAQGDDTLTATTGAFQLGGDASAQDIAMNMLYGGSGDDVLTATIADFSNGASTLIGGVGDDSLTVFGGSDNVLSGGSGNDTLTGSTSSDVMTGGGDADIFVFANDSGADEITDFDVAEGDQLDVSAVTNSAGDALDTDDVTVVGNADGTQSLQLSDFVSYRYIGFELVADDRQAAIAAGEAEIIGGYNGVMRIDEASLIGGTLTNASISFTAPPEGDLPDGLLFFDVFPFPATAGSSFDFSTNAAGEITTWAGSFLDGPPDGGINSASGDNFLIPGLTTDITYSANPGVWSGPNQAVITLPAGTFDLSSPAALTASLVAAGIPLGDGIVPMNSDPVANDDMVSTLEDQAVTFDPTLNDLDPDGDNLTPVAIVTGPANGLAVINSDGTISYTPDPDYNGPDSFGISISDGNGGSATSTVSVTVAPVPDDPVANDDTASTTAGQSVVIDVLANDFDVDGSNLVVASVVQAANGTVTIAPDGGSVTYTPDAGFDGTDSFTYVAADNDLDTDMATVTVDVTAVPVGPQPVFELAGVTNFNGGSGNVVNVAPTPDLEIDEGTIAFSFIDQNPNVRQGLVVKDASGFVGGGNHFAAYIDGGDLITRFQDGANSQIFVFNNLNAGQEYEVAATFGAGGVSLYVDDTLVGQDSGFFMNWEQNQEFLQVGGLGWGSAAGGSSFTNPFSGQIADVEIFEEELDANQITALANASSFDLG